MPEKSTTRPQTVLYVPMARGSEHHSRGHLFADCSMLTRPRYPRRCPNCHGKTKLERPAFMTRRSTEIPRGPRIVSCVGGCFWKSSGWSYAGGRPAEQLHRDTYDLLFRDLCKFCERRAAREAA